MRHRVHSSRLLLCTSTWRDRAILEAIARLEATAIRLEAILKVTLKA